MSQISSPKFHEGSHQALLAAKGINNANRYRERAWIMSQVLIIGSIPL